MNPGDKENRVPVAIKVRMGSAWDDAPVKLSS
jgi:hypothetical protein